MRHLDLFSGIGGFALAASWVWGEDHEIASFCEIDKYCQRVLKKHWPDVEIINDITDHKFKKNVDLVTAGFPCPDISLAGPGTGLSGDRSGLFWYVIRTLCMVGRPKLLLENVAALLHRGLSTVLGALATFGYDSEWHCIPAACAGSRHIRDRVWIFADPSSDRLQGPILNRDSFEKTGSKYKGCASSRAFDKVDWERWFPEPVFMGTVNDVPHGVDRLKGLGNAIVPQCVVPIMQAIKEIESCQNS